MKHLLLLLLLATAFSAQAQKKQRLRDLLYGGRLRSDSGSVVRSTDDLSTKLDTGTRQPAAPTTPVTAATDRPSTPTPTMATKPAPRPAQTTEAVVVMDSAASTLPTTEPVAEAEPAKSAAPKSNSRIWREYTDALTAALKAETLSNKKIKKGDYYFIIDYEINTDGTITVGNISCSPENPILQSEVKTRLENEPPKLSPVLDSAGNPRKLKRKQSFVVTKE